MEFLVRARVAFPLDMDQELRHAILTAERDKGAMYRASGHLIRTWRIPGRAESISLWRVRDATDLHTIHAGLPVYPYFKFVDVVTVAEHPIDPTSHEASPLPDADRRTD